MPLPELGGLKECHLGVRVNESEADGSLLGSHALQLLSELFPPAELQEIVQLLGILIDFNFFHYKSNEKLLFKYLLRPINEQREKST